MASYMISGSVFGYSWRNTYKSEGVAISATKGYLKRRARGPNAEALLHEERRDGPDRYVGRAVFDGDGQTVLWQSAKEE